MNRKNSQINIKDDGIHKFHKVMFNVSIVLMIFFTGILIFSASNGTQLKYKSNDNAITLQSVSFYQPEDLSFILK